MCWVSIEQFEVGVEQSAMCWVSIEQFELGDEQSAMWWVSIEQFELGDEQSAMWWVSSRLCGGGPLDYTVSFLGQVIAIVI